jgi:hypothetical protein
MIALLPLGGRRHTRPESGPVPSQRNQNTRRLPQRQQEEPGFSFLCLSPRQRGKAEILAAAEDRWPRRLNVGQLSVAQLKVTFSGAYNYRFRSYLEY